MLIRRVYYSLKPTLPWGLRMALRRTLARRIRKRSAHVWPILESAGRKPEGWPGWPGGKQFALVLTHDVEGPEGLAKVISLAELEMKMGFRSSFGFVPEGAYAVARELRQWLVGNGFEVGVHDLHHDGKLFSSREGFRAKARRINGYLKEWNAAGFRAGFMHHDLEWQHDLDVLYDMSTFDTDPFEPQPDGVETIFPFWVPALGGANREQRTGNREQGTGETERRAANSSPLESPFAVRQSPFAGQKGYVELPYTLAQDSTLFLLLQQQGSELWKKKLDWVAERGGMALVNLHPDFAQFDGDPAAPHTFPVARYVEFLEYVRQRYGQSFWQPLPREVAATVSRGRQKAPERQDLEPPVQVGLRHEKPKVWIDLDNTPHVPFFEPIIEELRKRGYPVLITARDAFQVCELASQKGLQYVKVGRHYGRNRILKVTGLFYRAMQLLPVVRREKPRLGLSHGARSQTILCNLLGLPTILLADYEYAQYPPLMKPTWEMVPEVIPDSALCRGRRFIRKYPGIKEDVYAWKLRPDAGALRALGISPNDTVVTVRPPATEAHYHNPESEKLFESFMAHASRVPGIRIVLLPRNKKQGDAIRLRWPGWFEKGKTVIPGAALDGLNLIWFSDLVVSGGGTMNREAAALGVPVFSIFRGSIGAVDRHLAQEGRLVLVESEAEVGSKIPLRKRDKRQVNEVTSHKTLLHIVDSIEEILETQT